MILDEKKNNPFAWGLVFEKNDLENVPGIDDPVDFTLECLYSCLDLSTLSIL